MHPLSLPAALMIPKKLRRYSAFIIVLGICVGISASTASPPAAMDNKSTLQWQQIVQAGENQDVYFHTWGGDPQINAYIQWAAKAVDKKYNINLVHVKLSDTSEAVSRVLAEKSANNNKKGSVDLIWINGANFAAMSENKLLLKDWASTLPNFALTDPDNNPSVTLDFGIPTNGMEAPWGQASLTFYYDNLAINKPPATLQQLKMWAQQNPGRFGYPKPPDFLGMSFLKYALVMLHEQNDSKNGTTLRAELNQPVDAQNKDLILNPLWNFLDELHPRLWRKGEQFLQSGAQMRRLVDDTELSLAFTFSGPEIPAAVQRYDLPPSIRSYAMTDGSLSNTHFVAIPYNASHAAAAQLVANFLLSPEAQAHKQNPAVWGDKTVLVQSTLSAEQQALFKANKPHASALHFDAIKRTVSEPHPSWVDAIMQGWQTRYGVSE
ncbi:ABC transporter substrate-binding protein [Psychrobacter sp. ANT_H56B]|uniref:ABC transporter substrate-binding protein n=1 Tax=Psychrobacter sp. ANT_H56B TaxID=2597353 RepID=UPI0011F26FD6|nr:ABC transporter substrate-binding protein [Psychrobacter sp. ANT_H56B]KAA0926876.1 ABC transporter substrate-binding protein [Psychrobacter sp. ANT_H56B]